MKASSTVTNRCLLAVLLVVGLLMALRPLAPGAGPENWHAGADKLLHVSYFVLLWSLGTRARLTPAWLLGLGLLLFGVGIEAAQSAFTETRSASFDDVLADAAGLVLGAAITIASSARQPKKDGR